jgi:hypothetical protein
MQPDPYPWVKNYYRPLGNYSLLCKPSNYRLMIFILGWVMKDPRTFGFFKSR